MTQRKPNAPKVRSLKDGEAAEFPKPDAAQVAQGAPPHEQAERPSDAPGDAERDADDRAHGYSQDSGYRSSGGTSGVGSVEEAGAREVEVRKRTSNGHAYSDEQIGKAVQMRLLGEPAPRATRLLVSVGDGVVTLSGEVDDDPERLRLLDIVRTVESVREVRDDLTVRAAGRPN